MANPNPPKVERNQRIVELRDSGMTYAEIAEEVGLSESVVWRIDKTERGIPLADDPFPCVCGSSLRKVIDTRPTTDGRIRRRRECESCGLRATTHEALDPDSAHYRRFTKADRDHLVELVEAWPT